MYVYSGWIALSTREVTWAMSGGSATNQSVRVRDGRDTSKVTADVVCQPTPIIPDNGGGITGTCTITGATAGVLTIPVNTEVTFTANPAGGTTPYTRFNWTTGLGTFPSNPLNSNTYKITYGSSSNYNTSVTVTDSGGVSNVAPIICGQVVVEADELDLFIGDTGPTANRKTYPVRQGQKFGLRWNNTLAEDADYNCVAFISNGGGTYWSDWQTAASTIKTEPGVSAVKSYNDTNGVPLGEYEFGIKCNNTDTGDFVETGPVKLRIVSVSEGEI